MKLILALALLAFGAGSATASITVFGGGLAQECSNAASSEKSDAHAILVCTTALSTEFLSPPDRGGTLINRGVLRLREGEVAAAHADFDAGIVLLPGAGEGWVNRGAAFIAERRYQQGIADIDRGLVLGVKEPEKAYYNRALAHEGLDDEKSAYLDYQQALVLKPHWDLPQHELLRFTVTRQ